MKTTGLEQRHIRMLAPLVLGNILNPLNTTMMATAIVSICGAFKEDLGTGALLIVPLYLTSAIGQPLMGRLADIFSARKINNFGFVLIFISALIGVFARNFTWLIVSRIILGLGTSTAYPSSMAIIRQYYLADKEEVPGMVLAIIATASQISVALGPFLGGVLTQHWGWQAVFFINIPIILIAIALSLTGEKTVTTFTHSTKALKEKITALDIPGVVLFSTSLLLMLLSLLYPTGLLYKVPLCIITLVIFIVVERRQFNPFIDVRLLASNPLLNTTFIRQIGINFMIYLVLYALPQWLEQTKKISPANIGLIMLPMSVAAMIIGFVVAKYKNTAMLLVYGTVCLATASVCMMVLTHLTPVILIVGITLMVGLAIGILTIANQSTLNAETPPEQTGISFGLFRTSGYLGAILAGSQLKQHFSGGTNDAALHSLAILTLIACGVVTLFLIPAFTANRKRQLIPVTK